MTHDQAKYLSSFADRVGIVNWAISEDRARPAAPDRFSLVFEGSGNLPRLLRSIEGGVAIEFEITREGDRVRLS